MLATVTQGSVGALRFITELSAAGRGRLRAEHSRDWLCCTEQMLKPGSCGVPIPESTSHMRGWQWGAGGGRVMRWAAPEVKAGVDTGRQKGDGRMPPITMNPVKGSQ